MKTKDLIRYLQGMDQEMDVMVRDGQFGTIASPISVQVENDVTDEMSGDDYGTCIVIEVD